MRAHLVDSRHGTSTRRKDFNILNPKVRNANTPRQALLLQLLRLRPQLLQLSLFLERHGCMYQIKVDVIDLQLLELVLQERFERLPRGEFVEFGSDVELGTRDARGENASAEGVFVRVGLGGWKDVDVWDEMRCVVWWVVEMGEGRSYRQGE